MSSKKVLLTGISENIRKDVLFQSAVHWAEEGFKVIYIRKSKFDSIPSTGHGPQIPSSEVLCKIRIVYLESMEELMRFIIDILTFRDAVPRVILVEALEEYLTEDSRDNDHQLSRICSMLCYVSMCCSAQCGLATYLLATVGLQLDKIAPVTLSSFDLVWSFDCDNNLLVKKLPLDDFPKVQLSLAPRYDGAYVLRAVSHLFVRN